MVNDPYSPISVSAPKKKKKKICLEIAQIKLFSFAKLT